LTVPAGAVITEKDRRFVYVVRDGRARKVPVTVGADDAIHTEITSGLDADAAVVVSGPSSLQDGSPVRAEPRATSGERSAG